MQDWKMTDLIRLEFDGLKNAVLEINRPNVRFLKTFVVSNLIAVEQSLK